MIALIQRVSSASVSVEGRITASIQAGMLALIGVQTSDTHKSASHLAQRVLTYRLFSDALGKMNLDLQGSGGQLLLVPQFTLAADTHKGRRPGFSTAAAPKQAAVLFDALVEAVKHMGVDPAIGVFGANMQVALVNDGPTTFWIQTSVVD